METCRCSCCSWTKRKHLAQPEARSCVTAFYTELIALSITVYFWKKSALGVLTLVIASLSAFTLTFFFLMLYMLTETGESEFPIRVLDTGGLSNVPGLPSGVCRVALYCFLQSTWVCFCQTSWWLANQNYCCFVICLFVFHCRCMSSLTLPSQGHLSAHEWMLLEHTMSPCPSVVCPGTQLSPGTTAWLTFPIPETPGQDHSSQDGVPPFVSTSLPCCDPS